MMRLRKTKQQTAGLSPTPVTDNNSSEANANVDPAAVEWEMRPGGMLVQKREASDQNSAPAPTIRVRVKHASIYHEITISSQATFGELKKKLSGPTGLHHEDQKIFYKDKERDSKAYLDIAGVKDKSKLLVQEDPISQEKRYLEMRKNAKMEKAAKSISAISLEVDRLAGQVSAFETVISKGGKVAEKSVVNLIELLMNELIKLDGIVADGDVKLQRKMQVRRVQKCVETLDVLKIKNAMPAGNGEVAHQNQTQQQQQHQRQLNGKKVYPSPVNHHQPKSSIGHSPLRPKSPNKQQQQSSSGTVVTTQWEIFESTSSTNNNVATTDMDSPPPLIPLSPTSTSGSAHSNGHNLNHHPKFNWELFD